MSPSDAQATASPAARAWRWSLLAVIVVAIAVRLFHLWTWSLWEDEEGTIYFVLNPQRQFPGYFPIFFLSLRAFFFVSGATAEAARVFSVAMGLISLWAVYVAARSLFSRETALLAVFFLALSVGHVFWSQSVRYYTTLLTFEVFSLYWFFRGFEEGRWKLLVLSNGAFVLALLTHFSAVLLIPVFIGYLGLAAFWKGLVPRYRLGLYLTFGLMLALEIGFFAERVMRLRRILAGVSSVDSAREPLHVLLTAIAYFGPPLLLLAVMAPVINRRRFSRAAVLMMVTAVVPLLELPVIASMNVINVAWYYGFISVIGFSVLAADGVVGLARQGARRWAAGLTAATVAYSIAILGIYFTTGHGDRPRWRDAAEHMLRARPFPTSGADQVDVFATAPNVVAFYLGVPANKTQGQTLVQFPVNAQLPVVLERDRWYVIPSFELGQPLRSSLESRCALQATFDTRIGPRDRTVLVYRCQSDVYAQSRETYRR